MKGFRKGFLNKFGGKKEQIGGSATNKSREEPRAASSQGLGADRRPARAPDTLFLASPVPVTQLVDRLKQPAVSWTQDTGQLLRFREESLCSICCNLNPNYVSQSSRAREAAWAKEEYSVAEETVADFFTVQDAKDLFRSANGGCFFCKIVGKALSAARPGWEQLDGYLHFHLAAGLPVVVRFEVGSISNVPMNVETLRSLGIDLPPGQNMQWTIEVKINPGPATEVEIFRKMIPATELTVGDVEFGRLLVRFMGFGEPISDHPGTQASFDFIQDNIDVCLKQHKCDQDGALPKLPDRVLWIEADNPSGIRLMEPVNIRARFIAVSYCWGPPTPDSYMTTADTLDTRKTGIDFDDLPVLFQDIVDIARMLGIEYIWIDRLCIIQGNEADFQDQASKMGQVYGSATLTIAAASATTEHDSILVERTKDQFHAALEMDISGLGTLKLATRPLSHALGTEKTGGDYGRMSTRAWIWQERLLAARTVFFTPKALKYECRCYSKWEGFASELTGHSWSAQLDNITHRTWLDLVEEYMRRDITRASDRLPAMRSVMGLIEKRTGWSPSWGLWASQLIEGLCWSAEEDQQSNEPRCKMNPGHYAPTWSWASVNGPISYLSAKPNTILGPDPKQWEPECRSLNGTSGLIRLSARVIYLMISGTIESRPDGEADEGRTLQCRYRVSGLRGYGDRQDTFPIRADVTLRSWAGMVQGELVSTVIRAPYGQAAPTQSWSALCACILLAKQKSRCTVLFLGQSPRQRGAWERVGMADGFAPSVFEGADKMRIDIV